MGDGLARRLNAAVSLWDDAYRSYGERLYSSAVTPTLPPAERAQALELSESVYEHAPWMLQCCSDHFVTDFADLRLLAGDPQGAARILAYRLSGIGRSAGLIAVAAAAYDQLGDTVRARELAQTFLDNPGAGGGVEHAQQAVRYREAALRILEGSGSTS